MCLSASNVACWPLFHVGQRTVHCVFRSVPSRIQKKLSDSAPGSLVALCPSGLHPGLPGKQARHRAVAHGEQLRPDVRLDVRDLRRVFLRPAPHLRLEVRQAGASGLPPDPLQHFGDDVAVSLSSALALAELPVPGQQTVRVLAFVARRLAHLVEDAHSLGPVRLGIRPASRADVFVRCLSRHVSHASILRIVSSIWQTGSSEALPAFVESVCYYGKLRCSENLSVRLTGLE